MHAQTSMCAGAGEADKRSELGRRPLWRRCAAVAAFVVEGAEGLLNGGELRGLVFRQEAWDGKEGREEVFTLERVSGSTSHDALDAMLGRCAIAMNRSTGAGAVCTYAGTEREREKWPPVT